MEKIYQMITDRIVGLLEKGTVPWHKPWGGTEYLPKSLISGKPYRGINTFMLHAASYESPYWLTFKQARNRGGSVKKGEKGFPCIYWNWVERQDKETGKVQKFPFLKYYTVFNVEQCDKIEYPNVERLENICDPIPKCEQVVKNMPNKPKLIHKGMRACYSQHSDTVTMPEPIAFDSSEHYYCTLFHELSHATGHKDRLNRNTLTEWNGSGSSSYSKEELVAEMGAAYLCGATGIERQILDNSASYINGWLKRLKEDNSFVVSTAGQAQKAADFVLGKSYSNGSSSTEETLEEKLETD